MNINKCVSIGLNNIYFDFIEINSDIRRIDLYLKCCCNHSVFVGSLNGTKINYLRTHNIEAANLKTIVFEIV